MGRELTEPGLLVGDTGEFAGEHPYRLLTIEALVDLLGGCDLADTPFAEDQQSLGIGMHDVVENRLDRYGYPSAAWTGLAVVRPRCQFDQMSADGAAEAYDLRFGIDVPSVAQRDALDPSALAVLAECGPDHPLVCWREQVSGSGVGDHVLVADSDHRGRRLPASCGETFENEPLGQRRSGGQFVFDIVAKLCERGGDELRPLA